MPRALPAAVLISAGLLLAGPRAGAADITTEQLHEHSALARALNARVHPPAPPSGVRLPPPGSPNGPPSPSGPPAPPAPAGPSWLTMLTPRAASGSVTQVLGDELSFAEVAVQSTHGLRGVPPFVTVTPALSVLAVNEPDLAEFPPPGPDLPSRLWGVSAGFTAIMPLSEQWIVQAGLSPGFYSDFENTSGDAFRMPGRLLGIYNRSPQTQFTVGVVYLDREDLSWLPALGMIHRPSSRTTLEFILPRPRVVRQLFGRDEKTGGFGYVAGELGGGSWAIERQDRPGVPTEDVVTISDLRLLAGVELRREGRVGFLAETGWAFSRDVEYESGLGDAEFGDAWLLRFGLRK
ncbi:DUF6268 family outer membrane beta-barrel protein [Alienimonas sp. DA493]|uniref:DUF6268 family outer membrane beta-barrel protein n=1 Tax=Alienimonas sp. DA493 TaxID=3373605 RepID=UPI0037543D46